MRQRIAAALTLLLACCGGCIVEASASITGRWSSMQISRSPFGHSGLVLRDVLLSMQSPGLGSRRPFRLVSVDRFSFHRLSFPASGTAKYPNASCEFFGRRSHFA